MTSPFVQTVLGSIPSPIPDLQSVTHLVALPDGDSIACEVNTPNSWRPEDPSVLMLHGLCGSHRSTYLKRMTRKFTKRGMRVVRMNLRGCGSGRGLARKPYHGGCSDDLLAVVQAFHRATPYSPLSVIGYSLGGNIALRLVGQLGDGVRELIQQVVAICPPMDLGASSQLIGQKQNQFYEKLFVRNLLAELEDRLSLFPDLEPVVLPNRVTLFSFDQLYTAPSWNYPDALTYYADASSLPLVEQIQCRTHILLAEDDPLIDPYALDASSLPANVQVWKTAFGGHLGFIGAPGIGTKIRWLDQLLLQWVKST